MHIPILSTFEDVIIDSVVEPDAERGKKVADKFNIPNFYDNYDEMYEKADLDAVFVCIPNSLHYNAVKNALNNDINVFCEKPMGLDPNETSELVKIAKNKNLSLGVGYNRRIEKNYEKTKKMIRSLKLGEVLQTHGILINAGPYGGWMPSSDWFFKDKYGVLYDSGSHLIDLMMYILSDNICEVSAKGIQTLSGVKTYDNISGFFKTENNILGSFNVGWRSGIFYDSLQVHGTGGSVFSNQTEFEFRHGGYGPLEKISDNFKQMKNLIGTFIGRSGRGDIPDETFFKEDRAFIDSISSNSEPIVSGGEALKVLEVLDGIKKSLDTGKVIKIK